MTLAELRQAAQLLAPGSQIALSREALLDALGPGPEPLNGKPADEHNETEALLDAKALAARLGTSVRWVYDHATALGGQRLSRRCLRFSDSGVERYLKRRTLASPRLMA